MPEDFADKDSMALSENELPKLRSYEPLQLFFLLRLGRLLRLRPGSANPPDSDEWLWRLVSKAVYSTYQDCLALGLRDEVQVLFNRTTAERSR